jgi:hypothetical protein
LLWFIARIQFPSIIGYRDGNVEVAIIIRNRTRKQFVEYMAAALSRRAAARKPGTTQGRAETMIAPYLRAGWGIKLVNFRLPAAECYRLRQSLVVLGLQA